MQLLGYTLGMATIGLKLTGKKITVTDPFPRRTGRPKGRKLRTTSVIRVEDTLIRQCRKALIEASLPRAI